MIGSTFLYSALLGLAGLTEGAQFFSNKGVLNQNGGTNGWSHFQTERNGKITEVTNVFSEGPTALKMTQTYDSSWTGRYHSEVGTSVGGYKRGDNRFYGFQFRLSEDWQFSDGQSFNIAQFIADFSGQCSETFMPSSMLWLEGNQLHSRVKTGSVCPTSAQITTPFRNLATVTAGAWHKIVMQVNWRSDSTGLFKVWYDGEKVVEHSGIKTTVDNDKQFMFRVGLYANGWHDQGTNKGQSFRQIWFDEIAVGEEFKDADPAQW
ncbi:polysaccharide lyase family 20 protein [Aaosphaeria arxii CBS 175.79]|uniref:Polysaccharide lyase family 20 protein n=1 Tax=Aaosphaeria arxii CBS 175.79 TaxID=1450172 RepID=A0A6A5X6S7_9PLEO|nr:polysaccharide lyase family 20 protein [Aaosphaeria arxii CBS 175.79]KAF2008602.1 polysaccharide lyase family 20 protein [Aaosphaeria arxii CBS 175.79]